MKRIAIGLAIWLLHSASALADPPKHYPFVAYDEALRVSKRDNKPMFVYFGRFGCAWCDQMNKTTFADPGIRDMLIRHYTLVYVDSESGKRLRLPSGERITEAELGTRFRALVSPVFMFLEADGKEILRLPGIHTVKNFQDYDRFVTEGQYRTQTLLEFLKGQS